MSERVRNVSAMNSTKDGGCANTYDELPLHLPCCMMYIVAARRVLMIQKTVGDGWMDG
jgi:hypothetical protein